MLSVPRELITITEYRMALSLGTLPVLLPLQCSLCFYLGFSSASTVFLLMSLLLFPSPSCCPLKCLSSTTTAPFTLSLSAHSLQGLHMAHAPASLKASTSQQTSPDKDHCSLYLILVFQQRYSENTQKTPFLGNRNSSLRPDQSKVFSVV